MNRLVRLRMAERQVEYDRDAPSSLVSAAIRTALRAEWQNLACLSDPRQRAATMDKIIRLDKELEAQSWPAVWYGG